MGKAPDEDARFVSATWGSTARRETTALSDEDLLIWRPDGSGVTAKTEPLSAGTYRDILEIGGRADVISEWARGTATDYQALLFCADINGPADLVAEFQRVRESLWADEAMRAKEVWMLVGETLRHPVVCTYGIARPEKYALGGTRSWVTIAEAAAMINGWTGRLSTHGYLARVEGLLSLSGHAATSAFAESMGLRADIEAGVKTYAECTLEYQKLKRSFMDILARLIDASLAWLQSAGGAPATLVTSAFTSLFGRAPSSVPEPRATDAAVTALLKMLIAEDEAEIMAVLRANRGDWFVHYAVTTNAFATGEALHFSAFPDGPPLPRWQFRNVRLWVCRHPAIWPATLRRILATDGFRDMDYAAASEALQRVPIGEQSSRPPTSEPA